MLLTLALTVIISLVSVSLYVFSVKTYTYAEIRKRLPEPTDVHVYMEGTLFIRVELYKTGNRRAVLFVSYIEHNELQAFQFRLVKPHQYHALKTGGSLLTRFSPVKAKKALKLIKK